MNFLSEESPSSSRLTSRQRAGAVGAGTGSRGDELSMDRSPISQRETFEYPEDDSRSRSEIHGDARWKSAPGVGSNSFGVSGSRCVFVCLAIN